MARDTLNLASAVWQVGQVNRQPFMTQPADDRSTVASWLPARVPGDIRADLLAAGRISSLDTPDGIAASAWVDDHDWWYRTSLDAAGNDTTVVLEADGIDYASSVWLDGVCLAQHAGMFARQSIVLSPYLNAAGPHELAIRVWGGGALPLLPNSLPRRKVRTLLGRLGMVTEYFPDRMATPKAQFSFGWDFSPRVLSTGIWDDIRLVRCRGAYLADAWVFGEPLSESDDPTPVRWHIRVRVHRVSAVALRANLVIRDAGGDSSGVTAGPYALTDEMDQAFTVDMPMARRWWPWDHGHPHLYRISICINDESGPLDEIEITAGVRSVSRGRLANGHPWRFTINGRPVFLRGANWVPADILPGRAGPDDYARLVGLARDAGINFLRIWGGGIREKAAFWEQCDRQGIMAMQKFQLACAFLGHYPRDAQYLGTLAAEARGIVTALRGRPSLIAWCGGNEINPRRERLPLRMIEQVVEAEDGTRPWIPASPSQGDVHQWDVWHGRAPWESFGQIRAPFMSEFGLQALPHADTVRTLFTEGVPQSLDDARWAQRKLQAAKIRHYSGPMDECDLVSTIETTQRAQSAGLQKGIEACRVRREGSGHRHPCGGVAFWQFNEPWPAVTWAVVDRYGRPKNAYTLLCRSYQPLLIAALFDWRGWRPGETFGAEIWWVNDGPESLEGCAVKATLDGEIVLVVDGLVIQPLAAQLAGSFAVTLSERPSQLDLTLFSHQGVIASNGYDLGVYQPARQAVWAWLLRRGANLMLRVG